MKFKLRHDSGFDFNTPEGWEETLDNNQGSWWWEKAGNVTLGEWKARAKPGERYEVATSVYLESVPS